MLMSLNKIDINSLLTFIESQKLKIKTSKGWKNFSENIDLPEVLVFDVKDISSLQKILKRIYKLNEEKEDSTERIVVRVAAGKSKKQYHESYSFTDGLQASIIIRLVGKEFKGIEKTNQRDVVKVGASMQIGKVDEMLYEKFNLALPTSSLIPYVTVSGLAANAGHGTGLHQPSFSGLIEAMTICLPNGEIVRIDKSHPDFETIRGAHLGLFGVILSLELKCMEAKKLQCVMQARSLPELLDEIEEGLFLHDPYVSIMYVPTYQPDELTNKELKNVIVYRWRPVDKMVTDVNDHPNWSHLAQSIEIKMEEGFHITDFLRECPELIPYYMTYLVTRIAIGKNDKISVGPWPRIHYQTAFPKEINDFDCLFEVGKDCKEISHAFKKLAETLMEAAKNKEFPVTYAAYARLIAGTNGGLSTSQHQNDKMVCGFDVVSSPNIPGYEKFKNTMLDFFIEECHGKPHWGKDVPLNIDYAKLYGNDFIQFKQVLEKWYVTNEMSLENSMLLNNFFCKILQLPYLTETFTAKPYEHKQKSSLKKEKMAEKVLSHIVGDDLYAENLRKHLKGLAVEKESSVVSQSIFMHPPKEMPVLIPKKKKKKSPCVII